MAELLKNLFNKTTVELLAQDFKAVYPKFNTSLFMELVFDKRWEKLELKERMHHAALCLKEVLPADYNKALNIIIKTAKERLPLRDGNFANIMLPDFVSTFGIDYPEISIDALAVLTPYPSSEFAIRPFILRYPDMTIKKFYEWSKSKNHHVRRFASEGCRPRLPWGLAIPQYKKDPAPIIPILETLIDDSSDYVRKSVANNLNDISKDNPGLFLEFVKKWYGKNDTINQVLKQASRTLLKKGNADALAIFGFHEKEIAVKKLKLNSTKVKIGGELEFSFTVINKESTPQKLRLEYKIYYAKSNGKQSPKVFQITETVFEPRKEYEIVRRQSFKDMTTRKHYKGIHKLAIVVNGAEAAVKEFEVI